MRTKKFGSNLPAVSAIGQGTWYIDRGDRKAAVAALRRGIELGMTHIDTAEMYGDAELVIAEASPASATRLFLVSKGIAEQRLAPRHRYRLRAVAEAAEDRYGWIAICCTGAAPIRLRKPSLRSTSW